MKRKKLFYGGGGAGYGGFYSAYEHLKNIHSLFKAHTHTHFIIENVISMPYTHMNIIIKFIAL